MVDKRVNGQIQELQKKVEDLDQGMGLQVHLTMGLMLTEMLQSQEAMAKAWRAQLTEAGFGIGQEEVQPDAVKQ